MLANDLDHAIRLGVVQLCRFPVGAEHDQPGQRRLHPAIDVAAQRALVYRVVSRKWRDDWREDSLEGLAGITEIISGIRSPMRTVLIITAFGLGALGIVHAQITANPIPAPIEKRGITVELRDVVRLPETRGMRPPDQDVNPAGWARVSFVRDAPDGRRFVNDSRGFLYLLRDNKPSVYLDFASQVQHVNYSRLESGLIGFTFHPEFPKNGLLYTVHAEFARDNPAKPNFIPPGYTDAQVTHHNVITEWRAKNPAANTFEGTRRELLRVAHIVQNQSHPMGAVEFDPDGQARLAGLRPALHQRQRSRVQQRRRPARQQPGRDAAARLADRRHPALRSAEPVGVKGDQGTWRLHDPAVQPVCGG